MSNKTFQEVEQAVHQCLNWLSSSNSITLDTKIEQDLQLDSLDIIELCMGVEEELNISIDESKIGIDETTTIKDVIESIVENQTKALM